ncbi:hypothetical protein AAEO57_17005 [Flavobacterium sp. DGU38]|uniref:PrgI family protein n=1 Tax=Flavobacterium calami TaxID=3139144 RepID=A0ABU9ISR6_9FLAO
MTKLQVRAFLYQLGCFAILFILGRFVIAEYTGITGIWIPLTAFIVATLVAPQFKALKTKDGEKLFMKWIFMKEVKEIGK